MRYRLRVRKIATHFNFYNYNIVSTVYLTEKCNMVDNVGITQTATLVWKTKVSEVYDLKQGKQVLAERKEEHSQ